MFLIHLQPYSIMQFYFSKLGLKSLTLLAISSLTMKFLSIQGCRVWLCTDYALTALENIIHIDH